MQIKSLIISRTDNLGDVVLTLPIATVLKQHLGNIKIIFLCRPYATAIIEASPDVDEILLCEKDEDIQDLANKLKDKADAILHVFPRKNIAIAAKKANIRYRIGTNRRWYHWLTCNKLINFTRSNSELHEAQLNLKLLSAFNINTDLTQTQIQDLLKLTPTKATKKLNTLIDKDKFTLIIQASSNNNSRDWPMSYYLEVCAKLPKDKFQILLNGVESERNKLQPLCQIIPKHQQLFSLTLDEKLSLFSKCDGMLSGSTGPLHIAAALGIHCLGLFPPKVTMNPKRWAPIGAKAEFIVNQVECPIACTNNNCQCMKTITTKQVVAKLLIWL